MSESRFNVGMHRPAFEELVAKGRKAIGDRAGFFQCSCGTNLWALSAVREHWQLGHFDEPVCRASDSSTPDQQPIIEYAELFTVEELDTLERVVQFARSFEEAPPVLDEISSKLAAIRAAERK